MPKPAARRHGAPNTTHTGLTRQENFRFLPQTARCSADPRPAARRHRAPNTTHTRPHAPAELPILAAEGPVLRSVAGSSATHELRHTAAGLRRRSCRPVRCEPVARELRCDGVHGDEDVCDDPEHDGWCVHGAPCTTLRGGGVP